ncbi:MAG: type II toxin-antitoxin system VapC family toxin [Acidobacteria bacterium]|nr:type II toxin-antitoxin system VapC family toxin [Acidobacteriota bacterium]
MTTPLVVPDASVLLKWALQSTEEEDRDRALTLRDSWLAGGCRILVPSLWAYEVGNVLGLKQPKLARALMETLLAYRLEEAAAEDLYPRALEMMSQLKVTLYDAAYHAAALEKGGTLVTADAAYVKRAARLGHVRHLQEWST